MYRFHPSVKWGSGYPDRQQIVSQIRQLWKRYGLEDKTRFNTPVTSVTQDKQGRWIINDPSLGRFDGVIAAISTCGDPKMPHLQDQEKFKGEIFHSSKLDGKTAEGKKVLICRRGRFSCRRFRIRCSYPCCFYLGPCSIRQVDHPKKRVCRHNFSPQYIWPRNPILLDSRILSALLLLPRFGRSCSAIRRALHGYTNGKLGCIPPNPTS